jgi:(+)-trans-carveol dehydrogenase
VGRVEGKVAFITGAARGQGRSHAIRLAEEGADIIAVDVCQDIDTVPCAGATDADPAETAKLVEALDRRIVVQQADVRDLASQRASTRGCPSSGTSTSSPPTPGSRASRRRSS